MCMYISSEVPDAGVRNTQYRNIIWDTVERAPTLTGEAWVLCLFIYKDAEALVMHNHGNDVTIRYPMEAEYPGLTMTVLSRTQSTMR